MKTLSFPRCFGALLWLGMAAVPGLAQTATPTPIPTYYSLTDPDYGIFTSDAEADEGAVRDAAREQAADNGVPAYKSNGEETRFYEGYFKAASSRTRLALLSDDGTSVWIDGVPVLTRANQNQGFQNFDSTFTTLSPTFVAGRVYHLRLEYTNTIHQGDADVDGISLWAYNGGGEIVSPSIDVDMDVDNTTMSGYPVAANGDRGEAEEEAENTGYVRTFTNLMDADGDGVPGYADGIDKFGQGQANASWKFEPMVVELLALSPSSSPNGRWVFRYSASDPNAITTRGTGEFKRYLAAPGVLRIWKKDGNEVRGPLLAHEGGDFVANEQAYTSAQLGFGSSTSITLYVEAVDWYGFDNFSPITVEFYPAGLNDTTNVFTQTLKVRPYYISRENPGGPNTNTTNTE